jgi:AraC-like DNA-binding protein
MKVLLSLAVLLVVSLILTSATLHFNAEHVLRKNQTEANRKVLLQMTYQINQMNETIKSLAISVFYSQNTVPLLYSRSQEDLDMYEFTDKMNLLRNVVTQSSHLHSIVIFNDYNKKFYATDSGVAGTTPMSEAIKRYVSGQQEIQPIRLLPVRLQEDQETDLFSMFVFERFSKLPTLGSFMAINVKPEWLFDNLETINSEGDTGEIFIIDAEGNSIVPSRITPAKRAVIEGAGEAVKERSDDSRSFTVTIENRLYFVSFAAMDHLSWKAVSVQPYEEVVGDIVQLRMISIVVSSIFLVMGLFFAFYLGRRIYKPIDKVLQQFGYMSVPKETSRKVPDELAFMSQRLTEMNSEKNRNLFIFKQHFLRKLITESAFVKPEELESAIVTHGLAISRSDSYRLLLFEIDHYYEFESRYTELERSLYKFAIGNVAGECLSPAAGCETVDLQGRFVGAVISGSGEMSDEECVRICRSIQEVIHNYYGISFTASVSGNITEYKLISKHYTQLVEVALYRMKYGHRSVILPSMVEPNIGNMRLQLQPEWIKKLVESLRTGKLQDQKLMIRHIVQELYAFSYEGMMHSILQIASSMATTISDMNRNRLSPILIDIAKLNRSLTECETLQEVVEQFDGIAERIAEQYSTTEENKNKVIVETVKEVVKKQYPDLNLSLQSLSAAIKISSPNLSKLFKQYTEMSIPEFINEVRLQEALVLLRDSDYTINEITERVGYANETYFFKLFKRKFGTTPKEYRLKKTLE